MMSSIDMLSADLSLMDLWHAIYELVGSIYRERGFFKSRPSPFHPSPAMSGADAKC